MASPKAAGFAAGGGCGVRELVRAVDEPHAFPAAASGGFEEQGVADLCGCGGEVGCGQGVAGVFRESGEDGHSGGGHGLFGADFVAHGGDRVRGRADEDESGRSAGAGEAGVFGEEPVAGVDEGCSAGVCRGDDRVPVQVVGDA